MLDAAGLAKVNGNKRRRGNRLIDVLVQRRQGIDKI
jgi:hypothetical protein